MRIKFDNVTCGYGKKAVLKNINCDIELGDKVAVLGPNGIGKSTLFKTLFGFIDIIDGAIYLEDRNIRSYTGKQLASILAYVPQAKGYSYQYTVEDMVLMGRASHIGNFSKPTKSDVEIAVDAEDIFGYVDAIKLKSSMTLFHYAGEMSDENSVFYSVLSKYYNGEFDERTLELIEEY